MGMNNTQLYKFLAKYIGSRGGEARNYCGLPSGAAWCCACVTWTFYRGGDSALFYGGKKVVYVPTAEMWCRANLAEIPIYLAMPMDIITFDWNRNGVPDHIGFVRDRKSGTEVYTIEGNTSGGIVACKTRPVKYVSGCFRPQFAPTSFTTLKALEIDGQFGYNSIACLQLALHRDGFYKGKIDAILGKETVKALQKKVGVAQDGSWGVKTTRAVQKWLNIKVTGVWDKKSTMSLQRWCNQFNEWYAKKHNLTPQTKPTPAPAPKPVVKDRFDKANDWAAELCKGPNGKYKEFTDRRNTQLCALCYGFTDPDDEGMNCINAWTAYLKHGAGIKCNCGPEVINNAMGDRLLRSNHETAQALVRKCLGNDNFILLSEGGKPIPLSKLKKGDGIMYFDGKTFSHMGTHIGNGRLFDCARGHSPQMQCGKLGVDWWTKENGWQIKLAIRYTGK